MTRRYRVNRHGKAPEQVVFGVVYYEPTLVGDFSPAELAPSESQR